MLKLFVIDALRLIVVVEAVRMRAHANYCARLSVYRIDSKIILKVISNQDIRSI